jgi:hypothetical protein
MSIRQPFTKNFGIRVSPSGKFAVHDMRLRELGSYVTTCDTREEAEAMCIRQQEWADKEAAKKEAAVEAAAAAAAAEPPALAEPQPRKNDSYRTVHNIFGEGRIYADMPGATHYKGTSGKYDVQIWDES